LNVRAVGTDDFDLREIASLLWRRKWWLAAASVLAALLTLAGSFLMDPVYRAEAVLAPVEDEQDASGLLRNLGGLAGLAGIRLGEAGPDSEPLAVLKSRRLLRELVAERGLVDLILGEDWRESVEREYPDRDPEYVGVALAVDEFQRKLFEVDEDPLTGLVVVSVEWTDADAAAGWVRDIVTIANEMVRARHLQEAERNLNYLREQLSTTNLVAMQAAISSLIENEMNTIMLAKGREEYSFTVVDPPVPEVLPVRPRKALLTILAGIFGFIVAATVVLVRNGAGQRTVGGGEPASV
jgi:uncharacterized protein involved in exopolysaccharide biosynthesis